jgi:hypothetical protein
MQLYDYQFVIINKNSPNIWHDLKKCCPFMSEFEIQSKRAQVLAKLEHK